MKFYCIHILMQLINQILCFIVADINKSVN